MTDWMIILKMIYKKVFVKSKANKIYSAVINIKDIKVFIMQIFYLPYNIFYR